MLLAGGFLLTRIFKQRQLGLIPAEKSHDTVGSNEFHSPSSGHVLQFAVAHKIDHHVVIGKDLGVDDVAHGESIGAVGVIDDIFPGAANSIGGDRG